MSCDLALGHECSGGGCVPHIAWGFGVPGNDIGNEADQRSVAVTVDPADQRVYLAAAVSPSSTSTTIEVYGLEPDGTVRWSTSITGFDREVDPEALSARGSELLVAIYGRTGGGDTVVLDSSDGSELRRLGLQSSDAEITPSGDYFLTGLHYGAIEGGDVSLPAASSGNVFLLRMDSSGVLRAGASIGDPTATDGVPRLAVDDLGNAIVAAPGDGRTTTHDGESFADRGLMASFAPNANVNWVEDLPVVDVWDVDIGSAVVAVVAQGDFAGTLGGEDVSDDRFVAGFRPGTGAFAFVQAVPSLGGVREGASGDLRTYVSVSGPDLQLDELRYDGSFSETILASIDISGQARWLFGISGSSLPSVRSIADGNGFVVLAGRTSGSIDLGDGTTLPSSGGGGVFALRVNVE